MPGLFQILEIGRRALLSQQANLQTIGHNIANVDTPGYSRQRVLLRSTLPQQTAGGLFGTGVSVGSIRQVRDLFLGVQFREANKSLGEQSYLEKTLSQIESIFNEPQDNSLGNSINEFFNAFSSLSTDPGNGNNRRQVIAKANQLISGFKQLGQQLETMRSSLNDDLNNMTAEVNRLTSEIADINQQVKIQELGGNVANDLRDRRDLLIDNLSSIIDVHTNEQPNGTTTVYMGRMAIVDGGDALIIESRTINSSGVSTNEIAYKGTTITLRNRGGEMAGLLASRDEILPRYMDQLNELARSIMNEVNSLHRTGFGDDGSTGLDFFDVNFQDVTNMRLNRDIEQDINKIAASSILPGVPGEGDNVMALAISDLRGKKVLNGGAQSISEFYAGLIGDLGIETRQAISVRGNTELLLRQVDNNRQSVQGVSLDEEMIKMIAAQRSFDAAARVITAMDQALDTVISGMGVVGR